MKLVFITDKNGNKVLPITSFSSVRDTNGNNLNLVLLTKVNSSEKGLNNGIATLDNNGKIPSSQLPSYVDDVIEGYYHSSKFYEDSNYTTEITSESGKIYIDKTSEKTYRWSGSVYVEISSSDIEGVIIGSGNLITPSQGVITLPPYESGALVNPSNATASTSGIGGSAGLLSAQDKEKLDSLAVLILSDWNQTNTSAKDFIKNKPTIPTALSQFSEDTTHRTVSDTEKTTWNNKVDKTTTVNGHALSGNVTVTKSDVELGNVGNFKAVSTEASQGLSETEKTNARTNIGAGTSSFSGNYNDLNNTPNIYTQNEIDTKIGNIGNQSVKQYVDDKFLSKCIDITYSALKALRDNSGLHPGQWYRITDYVTTVGSQITNARSAGHRFDLVVLATSSNTLSNDAKAVKHEYPAGDSSAEATYFDNCKLDMWKIEYCLDNDTDRFEWACATPYTYISVPELYPRCLRSSSGDVEGATYPYCWTDGVNKVYTASETPAATDNAYSSSEGGTMYSVNTITEEGKGVIYRMVDEYNNDVPYDFKNVQFKRAHTLGSYLLMSKEYVETETSDELMVAAIKTLGATMMSGNDSNILAPLRLSANTGSFLGSTLTGDYVNQNGGTVSVSANAYYINYVTIIGGKKIYAMVDRWDYCYTFSKLKTSSPYEHLDTTVLNGAIKNNTIEPYIAKSYSKKQRILNNIVSLGSGSGTGQVFCGNSFKQNCYNISIGGNSVYNRFDAFCHDIYIQGSSDNNTFSQCDNMYLGVTDNSVVEPNVQYCITSKTTDFTIQRETKNIVIRKSYIEKVIIESGNQNLIIDCSATTSSSVPCKNIKVAQGVNNSDTPKTLTVDVAGQDYQIEYKNANSEIRQV